MCTASPQCLELEATMQMAVTRSSLEIHVSRKRPTLSMLNATCCAPVAHRGNAEARSASWRNSCCAQVLPCARRRSVLLRNGLAGGPKILLSTHSLLQCHWCPRHPWHPRHPRHPRHPVLALGTKMPLRMLYTSNCHDFYTVDSSCHTMSNALLSAEGSGNTKVMDDELHHKSEATPKSWTTSSTTS